MKKHAFLLTVTLLVVAMVIAWRGPVVAEQDAAEWPQVQCDIRPTLSDDAWLQLRSALQAGSGDLFMPGTSLGYSRGVHQ